MKKYGNEFHSNFLARDPRLKILSDKERFIFALPEPIYKFNIIGAGSMGQEHLWVTLLEGRAIIHGIYDINPRSVVVMNELVKQKFPDLELKVYSSLENACFDSEVDGLIIVTPNYTHIDIYRTAITSGKHILMEKPMATTPKDAYEMLLGAKNYNSVFQVGLQYRYKAICVEAIHEALERKSLGNIKTISIQEHRVPFLDKVNQWNKYNKFSGGTLVEKCCHYFDLFNLFAQSRPKRVFASGNMAVNFKYFEFNGEKSDILDNAFVIIEYENGIRANFSLCMFAPHFYEEIVVCGDEGRLRAFEKQTFLDNNDPKSKLEIYRGENKPSRISYPCYPSYLKKIGHSGATYFEHKYFIENIEGNSINTATPEEGFWSIVVGYAAQESIRLNKPILIKDVLEKNNIILS
jgi:myo-inositol 2-dehydrogenase / D-chiro-inositol 1-dehydrogenase